MLIATATVAGVETELVEEVVVTGSRVEQAADQSTTLTEVLNRETIERSGARSLDELLEEHSGINLSRSFAGATVQMQGLSSEYVLVLVDGQRTITNAGGAVDLRRFDIDSIERIEIVKGASSALYGADALAGVINIITKKSARALEASARASYGSVGVIDGSGSVGAIWGPLNLRLSAGWNRSKAFDLSPEDPSTSGSAYDSVTADARAEVELSSKAKLLGRIDFLQRGVEAVDATSVAVFDRQNRQQSLSLTLGPDIRLSSGGRIRVTAHGSFFFDQFLYDQRNSSELDELQDSRELLGQINAQFDHVIGADHLLTLGTEGMVQRLESSRLEEGANSRGRFAIFIQDEWSLWTDKLVVSVGGRIDVDSSFGANPTPKLAVRFSPHRTLILRGSVGRGFRAPTFRQQFLLFENPTVGYLVRGNADLRPESSWSYSLSAQYSPWRALRFEVAGFRNDVSNLIGTASQGRTSPGSPELFRYVNIASARTQGIEAKIRVRLGKRLSTELGYTLLDAVDLERARRLEGRAAHRLTLGLNARYLTWGLWGSVRAAFVGARPFYLEEDTVTIAKPYLTLDARLEKALFTEYASLFAGLNNILNAGDARFLAIPPRSVYAGLSGRY